MKRVLLTVVAAAALGSAWIAPCRAGSKPPRIEKKLGPDSTILTLRLDTKTHPKSGGTFKVYLHVNPGRDFHIYGSHLAQDCCEAPLSVSLPPQLASFFEITAIRELGTLVTRYDSCFQQPTPAYYNPFDVVATVRVKGSSDAPIPFYLLVRFMTLTTSQCMPPRTFVVPMEVLGEKPIDLKIAHGKPVGTKRAEKLKASERSSMMKDSQIYRVSIVTSENNFREMMCEMNVGRGA